LDVEKQLNAKSQDEFDSQMQKCEAYSREIFTLVKGFIEKQLVPKINKIVNAYISQLLLKKDLSLSQFERLISVINQKIYSEIFKLDPAKVKDYAEYEENDVKS